ncbi:hypothetical protein [Natrarchaeobaculum sulfurireducens]|uniref:CopG family transcriptional regulator n=1 Tax=Natrarchaeobaculum sulfurireducens TaxID=2044521 RepID=A0A346PE60_9EURY|nr:hypothetical protein [Natrarchaeobaculum sulfurireducens]AXR77805.1 hypothetical protein AArc1_1471 [Natrarchaeobaculum sulfurireducens]
MVGEDQDGGGVSFALPADVDDWIAQTAAERGETREETCQRLLTAAHAVATDDGTVTTDPDAFEQFERDLEDQREEFLDLIEDVRSRVIQVKREADTKAPADHDHTSYVSDDDLEAVRAELDRLERRLEAGFDDFEGVLEHLLDRADDIDERASILGSALLEVRDRQEMILEREQARATVEQLKLAASQLGVRSATCDECGTSVDVSMLTAPECPACASSIADVESKSSFFGSHTLVTGTPPALEGDVGDAVASSVDLTRVETGSTVSADADADGDGDGPSDSSPSTEASR